MGGRKLCCGEQVIRGSIRALKHSECPTALDGGKLFPELDKAVFELKGGEVMALG